jgi:hypothetical protein
MRVPVLQWLVIRRRLPRVAPHSKQILHAVRSLDEMEMEHVSSDDLPMERNIHGQQRVALQKQLVVLSVE